MTKVSVIIPIFNQGAYLKECLRSFCNQSFQDLEILCVDDGSMDDSFEIAESIAKTDSRVKLVRRREPVDPETLENPSDAWKLVNLGRCVNEALERASGEYVMFPEADCYLRRNAVETMYRAACENELDILLADCFSFSDDRSTGDRTISRVRLSEKAEDYGNVFDLKARPELLSLGRCPQAGLFRRAFLREKKIGFGVIAPGKFRYTGFFIRSMAAAERIMAVDTPVYLHREIPAARVRSMWEACSLNREFDEAYADLMQDPACREKLRPYFWAEKARVYPAHLLKLRPGLQSRYAAYIAAELDRARERGYLTQEVCGSEVFSDLQVLMKSPEDYLTMKTIDVKDYAMHMKRSESYRIGAAAVKARSTAGKVINKGKNRFRFLFAGFFILFLMLWVKPQAVRALTFPSAEMYSEGKGGWVRQRLGYYAWKKADGTYITTAGFYELNGKIYFICGNSGRCYTGWLSYGSRRYYMDPDTGVRTTGWLELEGKKYYMDPKDGYLHTGFTKIGNYYYYFCNQGYMLTGWRSFNNARYYFYSRTGAMVRGWLRWRDNMYYFNRAGKLVTSQEAYDIDGRTYSIDENGICTEVFTVEFCTYNGGAYRKYSVKAGDSVAAPAMANIPGYTFMGWSTRKYCFLSENGSADVAFEMGEEVSNINGNLRFYAALFNYRNEPQLTTASLNTPNTTKYEALIMVGDSRTVRMKQALESRTDYLKKYPNIYFVAASGQRLQWLQAQGASQLLDLVSGLKEQGKEQIAIVFNLGVNTLRGDNIDFSDYVPYMQYLGNELMILDPSASLFYMSVNPVNPAQQEAYYEKIGTYLTICNPQAVRVFNATIRAELSPQFTYLDTYSYLAGHGYSTEDGLHYTTNTRLRYFNYMIHLLNAL